VQQQPNEAAETVAKYIKRTLENHGLLRQCIAFAGDNCNTMFEGLRWDDEGKNVFAKLINLLENRVLIGVGCPAHILNSCVHHAAENLDVDIECIIFKIYQ
jgi:hypothetical protein